MTCNETHIVFATLRALAPTSVQGPRKDPLPPRSTVLCTVLPRRSEAPACPAQQRAALLCMEDCAVGCGETWHSVDGSASRCVHGRGRGRGLRGCGKARPCSPSGSLRSGRQPEPLPAGSLLRGRGCRDCAGGSVGDHPPQGGEPMQLQRQPASQMRIPDVGAVIIK